MADTMIGTGTTDDGETGDNPIYDDAVQALGGGETEETVTPVAEGDSGDGTE